MGTYRLYCLDGVDKVASAEWIEAGDDGAAIDAAEDIRDGRSCELWQNSRLVARLGPRREGPPGAPPHSGPREDDPPRA